MWAISAPRKRSQLAHVGVVTRVATGLSQGALEPGLDGEIALRRPVGTAMTKGAQHAFSTVH